MPPDPTPKEEAAPRGAPLGGRRRQVGGALPLALALHLLGEAGAPPWAPRALAVGYTSGSVIFSGGYAVKSFGLAYGLPALVKPVAIVMISGGGLLLIGAAAAAAVVLRGSLRA